MPTISKIELTESIQRVYKLIDKYHFLTDTGIQQKLNPPASENQLDDFEKQLGYRLPPSYRIFLSLHNGWRHFEGDIHLLSIEELQQGKYAEQIKGLKQHLWETGQSVLIEGLIIGIELYSFDSYILDTQKVDKRGEMVIVNWSYDEIARYKDFLDMLKKTAKDLEEIIEEESKHKKKKF